MQLALKAAALLLALSCGAFAVQPPTLTGNWHLNVEKSKWGAMTKPLSVILKIEHNEPNLSYHGTVTYANEEERPFGFSGAFDGKPYPMSRSFGDGEIVMKRIDAYTIESSFRTPDGKYVESARTTLSRDGRTMTRALKLTSPEGKKNWTEIYEKR
ncbi:MAG: hypothetical protein HXY18_04210 [Bryobacteraceae bacterium]|nr:hypothetical protein [Bryobacteraceae bacterium]